MSNKYFYLIQRGSFNKNLEQATEFLGCSSKHLIDPDYMGSAEFEFGAIPRAFRRILNKYSEYKLHITDIRTIGGVPFCVYCRDEYYEEILTAIKEYLNNPYSLKEWSDMECHFKTVDRNNEYEVKIQKYKLCTNFWWCIDIAIDDHHIGDWIAFTGATDRQNKFIKVLDNTYTNWWMKKSPKEREEEVKSAFRGW